MEKEAILKAVKDFAHGDLTENAIHLFKSLGYNTSRSNPLQNKTFDYFKSAFQIPETFNAEKAQPGEWKYFDILFQVSNAEISNQNELWDNKRLDNKLIESYLFVVIELTKNEYSRSHLARICREVNKIFPMPVLVLFRYGENITLSVIDRRINKRRSEKDVLEKVTLIKDISIDNPHRAHIEILFDFSFTELSTKYPITNFIELHDAWQKTLDTKELNKRFYRELSYWYFWAMQKVVFPNPHGEDDHNAKSLIRLLTRLLFVWFVKEKGLVPRQLFDEPFVAGLLKTFDPHNGHGIKNQMKGSAYYRAVLQNLFFVTLNQECGQREFRKKGRNQNVTTLFRYEDYFTDARTFKTLLETIPFMNGGLFECLDKADPVKKGREGGAVINYEDGFSDRPDNALCVPDYLFFSKDEHADISAELDDPRLRDVKVDGLLTILNKYKFTIAENTPIEEDIALDPELLGRVFENLLASYNPETKTSARKQTGSFYTPREIVDYMADISIKAYLQQKLTDEAGMSDAEADAALELLIGYYENEHIFNDVQVQVLINAIDTCKILDPACGSGAFPMGVLHKLTFILGKLDPDNKLWKEKQRKRAVAETEEAYKIGDKEKRNQRLDEIRDIFDQNSDDYGRKLFLIENCIYGIDIQSIAIQISKLRFFISLIVDQKTDGSRNNFGVRPLPNLETKFVAANTLIGLEKPPEATALFNEHKELDACKAALKNVRHRLFSAKTPATKNKLRAEDKAIRRQIAQILIDDKWSDVSAKQIAAWEIDDQNASSPWFDAEWMFGVDGGFDMVIGNPPYLKEGRVSKASFDCIRGKEYYQGKMDLWYAFACHGIDFLKTDAHLSFIATNNWVTNSGASKLRHKIIDDTKILQLVDFGNFMIFESASIQTMVMLYQKNKNANNYSFDYRKLNGDTQLSDVVDLLQKKQNIKATYLLPVIKRDNFIDSFLVFSSDEDIFTKISSGKSFLTEHEIANGIHPHYDFVNSKIAQQHNLKKGEGIFGLSDQEKKDLKLSVKELKLVKPYYTTEQIYRYYTHPSNSSWLIYTNSSFKDVNSMDKYPKLKKHLDKYKNVITSDNKPYGLHRAREERFFKGEKIFALRKCVERPSFSYSDFDCYVSATFYVIKTERFNMKYLLGLLNSRLMLFWLKNKGKMQGENFQLDKEPLLGMPIQPIMKKQEKPFVAIVDQILAAKSANPQADTSALERQIDNLVYRLYNLTWDEVKVIEPEFPLGKAEYEGIEFKEENK